jgi:hypothetical protein
MVRSNTKRSVGNLGVTANQTGLWLPPLSEMRMKGKFSTKNCHRWSLNIGFFFFLFHDGAKTLSLQEKPYFEF